MSLSREWMSLFDNQEPTRLALWVREQGRMSPRAPRALADDEVLLLGGAGAAGRAAKRPKELPQPTAVMLAPSKGMSAGEFQSLLEATRKEFPQAELGGFGPSDWDGSNGLDRCVVKVGIAEESFQASEENAKFASVGSSTEVTAVLVYSPKVTALAIQEAVESLNGYKNLVSVVPLPLSAGDRIPLKDLTTAGTADMMVISALRYLLPPEVRVRASWAALGWKVAQLAVLYGADELAGWTASEAVAYTGRVRAAARVEREELEQGLEEAERSREAWSSGKAGTSL